MEESNLGRRNCTSRVVIIALNYEFRGRGTALLSLSIGPFEILIIWFHRDQLVTFEVGLKINPMPSLIAWYWWKLVRF